MYIPGYQASCFSTHCQSFKLFEFSFQSWIEFLKWREQLLQLCLEAAGYLLTFQVCCSLVTAPFMSPTVIAKNEFRLQKSLQLCMCGGRGAREKGDACGGRVPGRREMRVEGGCQGEGRCVWREGAREKGDACGGRVPGRREMRVEGGCQGEGRCVWREG